METIRVGDGQPVVYTRNAVQPLPAVVGMDVRWDLVVGRGLFHAEIWNGDHTQRYAEKTIVDNTAQVVVLRTKEPVSGPLQFQILLNTQNAPPDFSSKVSNVYLKLPQ